jgi:hypothetical protein
MHTGLVCIWWKICANVDKTGAGKWEYSVKRSGALNKNSWCLRVHGEGEWISLKNLGKFQLFPLKIGENSSYFPIKMVCISPKNLGKAPKILRP